MPGRLARGLRRYVEPLLAVAAAWGLTRLLGPLMEQNQFVFYVVAVMLGAWRGGLMAGLLATAGSTLAIHAGVSPPHETGPASDDLPRLALFLVVALGVNTLERARARADQRGRASEAAHRQKQQELEQLARRATFGELAAGIAHELSQPLSAVMVYSHGLSAAAEADPALGHFRAPLRSIVAQAQRASRVIEHYRRLVRQEATPYTMVDLAGVITDALELIRAEAKAHRVEVATALEPSAPLLGNAVELEQVFVNLLRNAVEAASASPVGSRRIDVRLETGQREAAAHVTDSGPGLAPDARGRLFEPFFTTKPDGLGMGLAIARTIVERHSGGLRVSDGPGGVTLTATFPLAPPSAHRGARARAFQTSSPLPAGRSVEAAP